MLESLASRCGQPAAMNWLAYFLTTAESRRKSPCLVLLLRSRYGSSVALPLTIDDVEGAVLLFEYELPGLRSGAFATYDESGLSAVIAAEEHRPMIAALAADAVMQHGAHVVLIAGGGRTAAALRIPSPLDAIAHRSIRWAEPQRVVEHTLQLADSYEDTLMRLGKSTRFNLRYYRRRLQKKLQCTVVPDVCGMLREDELEALNQGSLNPVQPEEFCLRYRSTCDLPGGFLFGLRAPDGKWLALIGGWRQEAATVLHWQVNAAGYEKDSIGTVARAYFLEHEVARGTRTLTIHRGTTHTMSHSFDQTQVADLLVRRRTVRAALISLYAWVVASPDGLRSRINFLTRLLQQNDLQWQQSARHARDEDGRRRWAVNRGTTNL